MGIKDLIELGKQGHSLADIKELVELGKALEESEKDTGNDIPDDEGKGAEGNEELKKEMENLKNQLNDANALIKKLQDDNIKKGGEPETKDELAEIGKLFF